MKRSTRTQIVCPILLKSLFQYQSSSPGEVLGARYLAKGTNENCMMGHKLYSNEITAAVQVGYSICLCWTFSIITQMIIQILALSLPENGVIFRYNLLRRGDYSGRSNFENGRLALGRCV